jgi:hypothetical protein
MSLLRQILVDDWRRKLVALALAFGLWWWVDGVIAHERSVALRVVAVNGAVTPENGTLTIQVPPGWKLVEPREGTSIPISLHGSRSNLENFSSRHFGAFCAITPSSADTAQTEYSAPITPEQLSWLRPEEAAQLLAGVAAPQALSEVRLERVRTAVLQLGQHLLDVRGSAAKDHEVMRWDARFEITQASLSGPHRVVVEAEAEQARAADEPDRPASLFEAIELDPTTRHDVVVMIRLAEVWRLRGLELEPAWVRVTIPVRLRAGGFHEWSPALEVMQTQPPRWQVPAYSAKWRASLKYEALPPGVAFGPWVEEHVLLLLPLTRLPADPLDQRQVNVEWTLIGLDHEEKASLLDALAIEAVDSEDASVVVTRSGS